MKAQQIQQQLRINSDALSAMYVQYSAMRSERKDLNDAGDACVAIEDTYAASFYFGQAYSFTPAIKKLRKRIASMEQIQVALKHELKCAACLEAWQKEDDAEWLQMAEMAREEGFVWSGTGQEFLAQIPVACAEE